MLLNVRCTGHSISSVGAAAHSFCPVLQPSRLGFDLRHVTWSVCLRSRQYHRVQLLKSFNRPNDERVLTQKDRGRATGKVSEVHAVHS